MRQWVFFLLLLSILATISLVNGDEWRQDDTIQQDLDKEESHTLQAIKENAPEDVQKVLEAKARNVLVIYWLDGRHFTSFALSFRHFSRIVQPLCASSDRRLDNGGEGGATKGKRLSLHRLPCAHEIL